MLNLNMFGEALDETWSYFSWRQSPFEVIHGPNRGGFKIIDKSLQGRPVIAEFHKQEVQHLGRKALMDYMASKLWPKKNWGSWDADGAPV